MDGGGTPLPALLSMFAAVHAAGRVTGRRSYGSRARFRINLATVAEQ